MTPLQTMRIIVSGRVQGVWFRGWTRQEATRRGLDGWVRNLSDGRVEAVFHGPADRVAAMIEACRQGPPSARVERLTCEIWDENPGHGFHQKPTM